MMSYYEQPRGARGRRGGSRGRGKTDGRGGYGNNNYDGMVDDTEFVRARNMVCIDWNRGKNCVNTHAPSVRKEEGTGGGGEIG